MEGLRPARNLGLHLDSLRVLCSFLSTLDSFLNRLKTRYTFTLRSFINLTTSFAVVPNACSQDYGGTGLFFHGFPLLDQFAV